MPAAILVAPEYVPAAARVAKPEPNFASASNEPPSASVPETRKFPAPSKVRVLDASTVWREPDRVRVPELDKNQAPVLELVAEPIVRAPAMVLVPLLIMAAVPDCATRKLKEFESRILPLPPSKTRTGFL